MKTLTHPGLPILLMTMVVTSCTDAPHVSVIRAIVPANWHIASVEQKTHPPQLVPGEGTAVRIVCDNQKYGTWKPHVVIYIMPRSYSGARDGRVVLSTDAMGPASLVTTTGKTKVYASILSHDEWPNMKEDILNALAKRNL